MQSLKELYRIGRGPSSSHTMGPSFVAVEFLAATRGLGAVRYEVELRDSLAATGRGHFTDRAVKDIFGAKRTKIVWKPDFGDQFHSSIRTACGWPLSTRAAPRSLSGWPTPSAAAPLPRRGARFAIGLSTGKGA